MASYRYLHKIARHAYTGGNLISALWWTGLGWVENAHYGESPEFIIAAALARMSNGE